MASRLATFLDTLYGDISLTETTSVLVSEPSVQRLRHVRLSNIDSIAIPGIAGLSRYEHVVGVAYLAQNTGLSKRLSTRDMTALTAAALLHDWAISAFGHLAEEAFAYVGGKFDHETKLYEMVMGANSSEIGGMDRQVFRGRNGLRRWLKRVAASGDEQLLLRDIIECTSGCGKFGRVVCGDIDLDNIDNVFRMAFHMGLAPDRGAPLRLARGIVGIDDATGSPVFTRSVSEDITTWLSTRRKVYERLMLAEPDFTAKLMLLYATVIALRNSELVNADWDQTDAEFISMLSRSKVKECSDTIERWLVGEFWATTPLVWMNGSRPSYEVVLEFSEVLTSNLDRTCFAYCIKDKRDRKLSICFEDGIKQVVGKDPNQWLLGVGSPLRKPFVSSEFKTVIEQAEVFFNTTRKIHATNGRSHEFASEASQLGLL